MRRTRLVWAVLVALTAPLLLLQGLAGARLAPGPIDWNGFWQADIGQAFLRVDRQEGQIRLSLREGGAALAMDAFAKEPLATNALFLLATNYQADGDSETMRQLLRLGLALDKRNHRLGAMQLEQAALARDLSQTFVLIDRLSTTNPDMAGEFVSPLSQALENKAAIPLLRSRLAARPQWAEAFWSAIPASREGVTNMYALRQLTRAGVTPASDGNLLSALVRVGALEDALDFWTLLSGPEADPLAFVPTDDYPPIGWQSERSGDRSFSAIGGSRYDIYVEDQTFGELARQLVRLQPGTYRFAARVSPGSSAGSIEASLECATGNSNQGANLPRQDLAEPARWSVGGDCEIYWLVLTGSAWERRTPLRASMSNMQFSRIN